MAFISPNLTKHDIQFLIGDDLGSDHLPIEISIDAQPHRNTHTNPIRYKFDQTDRDVFESTLEAALSSGDIPERKSTQDIDKYADFIVTAISTAVNSARSEFFFFGGVASRVPSLLATLPPSPQDIFGNVRYELSHPPPVFQKY